MNIKVKYVLMVILGLSGIVSFAHDRPVHFAITLNAAASASYSSSAYREFFSITSSDLPMDKATNSMAWGSWWEDNADVDEGGKRSLNHFYDPLTGLGLSDVPEDSRVYVGTNSFTWASVSNCAGLNFGGWLGLAGNLNKSNIWSWPNAREYEWLGLTASNKVDRNAALTNMFRAVGQVMHLLEDTSQPQHVRNEQHLDQFFYPINTPWRSPIEDYGAAHSTSLNYGNGTMLNWRNAGFTKLENFWNRHKYDGTSSAALVADNSEDPNGGPNTLGLAEWCNANFIGVRHSYPEYTSPGSIKYYPYPSRNTSTDYIQKRANLVSGIQNTTLKNGQQVQEIFLNKTSDGVTFPDISRFKYFGAKFPSFGINTINDPLVLSNIHNIFIPKAVEYSAGLLDYFFRGTMDVQESWETNLSVFTNTVLNTSGEDFHGGTFYLYQDDTNANRTLVLQTNLTDLISSGTLTNNSSLTIVVPTPPATKMLLVYQGAIGYSNGAVLDPVDASNAIAAARPSFEQIITNAYDPSLGSLGLTNGSTITTNLDCGDFPFAPTPGNYEVFVNYAYFDDNGAIGCDTNGLGGITAPVSTDCSFPHQPLLNVTLPASAVTIVGNHLQINITATDNSVCGESIGWPSVSITWRAWPSQ